MSMPQVGHRRSVQGTRLGQWNSVRTESAPTIANIWRTMPTDLTYREAQELGSLRHPQGPPVNGIEDAQAILISWCQGDRSHEDQGFAQSWERTFSLNAKGLTESWNVHTTSTFD